MWGIVTLHALLLVVWATLTLTYQAPDEPQHLDLVRVIAAGEGWPEHGTRRIGTQVVASLAVAGFHDAHPKGLPAEAAPPRPSRPTFAELGPDGRSDEHNQLTQHPPLSYLVLGGGLALLTAVGADLWAFDVVVGAVRLLGVVLLAPLPLCAHAAARRLEADEPVAVAAALFPLAIPQLTHIGASVNNDTLLVVLAGALTVGVVRVATGDLSWRTATVVGALAGAALLTKGLALLLLPWVGAAYLVGARRAVPRRAAAGVAALALGLATASGGWWWLRNVVVDGHLLPPGGEEVPVAGADFVPDLSSWAVRWLTFIMLAFWGRFGWLDVSLPWPLVLVAAAATGAGVVVAVAGGPAGGRARRVDVVLLLAPFVLLALANAVRSWTDHAQTGVLRGLQGRYLFAGVVGLGVVVAFGYGRLLGSRRRWLPLGVLAAALVMQVVGLASIRTAYWGAAVPGGFATRAVAGVRGALAWSPWPVGVPLAGVAAALVAAATVAVGLVRSASTDPAPRATNIC